MKPITNYPEIISHLQIEADRAAYEVLRLNDEKDNQRKFNLLNNYVDFNSSIGMSYLVPMFINQDAIDFILKNHSEIKRRFSIEELIDFSEKLKLLKLAKLQPSNFLEFKKMYGKIKLLNN
jgi:hypothetical protein